MRIFSIQRDESNPVNKRVLDRTPNILSSVIRRLLVACGTDQDYPRIIQIAMETLTYLSQSSTVALQDKVPTFSRNII